MPFQKGRPKTGGRKRGTHNKLEVDAAAICEQRGFHPIEAMIEIAQSAEDPRLKLQAAEYVARRTHPAQYAVRHDGALTVEAGPGLVEILQRRFERAKAKARADEDRVNAGKQKPS